MFHSPIRVVPGDVTGVTADGPTPNSDIDYQIDTGTLTATFSGFESQAHGISHIEFCVGTRPGWDDVIPFSKQGVIVEEVATKEVTGMIIIDILCFWLNSIPLVYIY